MYVSCYNDAYNRMWSSVFVREEREKLSTLTASSSTITPFQRCSFNPLRSLSYQSQLSWFHTYFYGQTSRNFKGKSVLEVLQVLVQTR